eukprot:TRINITY_DN35450_c0_g1_i1.p1 TRINITY_DN35450_c0_g1~~TRINITY_DN35450_c0_g1_i1.p1  ORF type:complete len:125 (+),score=20.83 TRINITY_DN35450_c0_g1_i1:49-423(+)
MAFPGWEPRHTASHGPVRHRWMVGSPSHCSAHAPDLSPPKYGPDCVRWLEPIAAVRKPVRLPTTNFHNPLYKPPKPAAAGAPSAATAAAAELSGKGPNGMLLIGDLPPCSALGKNAGGRPCRGR